MPPGVAGRAGYRSQYDTRSELPACSTAIGIHIYRSCKILGNTTVSVKKKTNFDTRLTYLIRRHDWDRDTDAMAIMVHALTLEDDSIGPTYSRFDL